MHKFLGVRPKVLSARLVSGVMPQTSCHCTARDSVSLSEYPAWFIFNQTAFANLCHVNRVIIPNSSEESFLNHSGSRKDSSLRRLRSEWHTPDEFVKITLLFLNHAEIWNGITRGIGVGLAIARLAVLVVLGG